VAESIGELSDTLVILSADRLIIRYRYPGAIDRKPEHQLPQHQQQLDSFINQIDNQYGQKLST